MNTAYNIVDGVGARRKPHVIFTRGCSRKNATLSWNFGIL